MEQIENNKELNQKNNEENELQNKENSKLIKESININTNENKYLYPNNNLIASNFINDIFSKIISFEDENNKKNKENDLSQNPNGIFESNNIEKGEEDENENEDKNLKKVN